jgi:rRNA-processing protein FCF1
MWLLYRLDNIEEIIEGLLGAKVKLFVPSCAFREIQQLSASDKVFRRTLHTAKMFPRHKDGCEPSISSTDCLLKQVGVLRKVIHVDCLLLTMICTWQVRNRHLLCRRWQP